MKYLFIFVVFISASFICVAQKDTVYLPAGNTPLDSIPFIVEVDDSTVF
ncbi:MAG: hypothetical protein IH948_08975, partial [Bacteroidetes bacterium]|nr:hypothetical protein [Bacteroidota bacterium]